VLLDGVIYTGKRSLGNSGAEGLGALFDEGLELAQHTFGIERRASWMFRLEVGYEGGHLGVVLGAGVGATGLEVFLRALDGCTLCVGEVKLQRDDYDGRLPTIRLAKSGSRRVARIELPV
jgi:hypothetical protein